jgi:hypothetical protein
MSDEPINGEVLAPEDERPARRLVKSHSRANIQAGRNEIERLMGDGGVLPIRVLIESMRMYWRNGEYDRACELAEAAAPYFHPKLASMELKADETLRSVVRAPAVVEETDKWVQQHAPPPSSSTRQ